MSEDKRVLAGCALVVVAVCVVLISGAATWSVTDSFLRGLVATLSVVAVIATIVFVGMFVDTKGGGK